MSVQIRQSINYLLATNYLCWIIFAVVTVCCIVVPIARSMFNTSKQRQVLMLTKNTACWCGHLRVIRTCSAAAMEALLDIIVLHVQVKEKAIMDTIRPK